MATTNLIADFLVIGVCSLIWAIPGLALLTDVSLKNVNDLGIAPSFALLGAAYVVGICINRFADDVTDSRNDDIRDEVLGKAVGQPSYHTRLNEVVLRSESAATYLSYRRSVIRITRACALNFVLGAVAWGILLVVQLLQQPRQVQGIVVAALVASTLLSLLLFRAWPVVLRGYFSSVKDMHECLTREEASD